MSHATRTLSSILLVGATVGCGDQPGPVGLAADTAPRAQRGGPPVPVDPEPFSLPELDELCGFPVLISLEGARKVLELPGGRSRTLAPGLHVTLTNVSTGGSVTLNVTGPVTSTLLPNGDSAFVFHGRQAGLFDTATGLQALLLIGRFTATYGADGSVVAPLEGTGRMIDLCELLS